MVSNKRITGYWKISSAAERVIVCVYLLAFAGAAYNHVADLVRHGLFPYTRVPLWINIYWTSLTALDPAAMALLLFDKNKGVFLYLAVIVSDVIINTCAAAFFDRESLFSFFWISQFSFMVFVLATFRRILRIGRHAGAGSDDDNG